MKKESGGLGLGLLVVIVFGFLVFYPVCLWTDRTLDFWVTHFKGVVVNVPFWLSVITTFVFNGAILAINVISEIIRFAMK